MLKAQLARALHLPLDTRADQGLHLLLEIHAPGEVVASTPEERSCDRVIAMLRARLSTR